MVAPLLVGEPNAVIYSVPVDPVKDVYRIVADVSEPHPASADETLSFLPAI